MDNTDQIVREYHGLPTTASTNPQSSRVVEGHSENHLDPSISNYRPEAPITQHVDLDLTPPRSVVLNSSVRHIAADPVATTQGQDLVDSGSFLQNTTAPLAWNRPLDQDNTSLASTLASTILLDRALGHIAPLDFETELPVSTAEQTQLIRAYLQETGKWCETTDTDRHFTVSYVHKLMENRPFVAAAMTLASQQLDALRHSQRQSTLRLYQYSVQSLLQYEASQCGEATLATCMLLSVYEMMASDVGEWRRHLRVGYPG